MSATSRHMVPHNFVSCSFNRTHVNLYTDRFTEMSRIISETANNYVYLPDVRRSKSEGKRSTGKG